jgi:hypothetical protein
MQRRKALYRFTRTLIDFLFYSGILVCILAPVIIYTLIPHNYIIEGIRLQITIVLMLSDIAALYILWMLKRIFKTLLNTDPFTMENVGTLRTFLFLCPCCFL